MTANKSLDFRCAFCSMCTCCLRRSSLLVVLLAAQWTYPMRRAQEPLEASDARQVKHVRAAEDYVLARSQVVSADRTGMIWVVSLRRTLLTCSPLVHAQLGWRCFDQSSCLSERETLCSSSMHAATPRTEFWQAHRPCPIRRILPSAHFANPDITSSSPICARVMRWPVLNAFTRDSRQQVQINGSSSVILKRGSIDDG